MVRALMHSPGIAAQQLSRDVGLQLLENAAATAAGLCALILTFGPISGAHFDPVVSLVDTAFGGLRRRDVGPYIAAHLLAEVVATGGLLLVIFSLVRTGRQATAPAAVGAYIGAAYWFTSSTSFANPAITVGRTLSDTFAGIAPASILPFVAAQLAGAAVAFALIRTLYPETI
jgi:glycerol uptake facilitator-like aquaporin